MPSAPRSSAQKSTTAEQCSKSEAKKFKQTTEKQVHELEGATPDPKRLKQGQKDKWRTR